MLIGVPCLSLVLTTRAKHRSMQTVFASPQRNASPLERCMTWPHLVARPGCATRRGEARHCPTNCAPPALLPNPPTWRTKLSAVP